MKLSIITVTYNCEETVARTLQSVASQTWPDIEHIVVDGASRDGTLDIVKRLGKRIGRVISESDNGIYDAINKGIEAASGDVIGLLHSDDHYAHSGVLSIVGRAMERTDIDALFGDVAFFRGNNPRRLVRRYRSSQFSPRKIAWGWMPAHPALFVRRGVFKRVGPFRTDYRIAGDFEWVARAFYPGTLRYSYIPEVLVHMRMGGISTGGWRNSLLLNREVMRACRENGIRTNWLKILSKYPAKLLEFVSP